MYIGLLDVQLVQLERIYWMANIKNEFFSYITGFGHV